MGVGDPNSMGASASASVEEVDRVKSLQSQVDGVKDIMTQNVERILARGERLDDLMDKSEDLQAGAQNFKHTSQKVARAYWWKNVKLIMVIVVIVVVILLIIVLLATGVIPTSTSAPPPPTSKPPK
ncbi:hypothetical protein PDJAM_G00144260 [Pangasius djambal]|uniref:Uncharacterized protein n=1 Tax=Pangasius djambal TaxID=1691987 RepID=A0ACC5ZFN0_9TELE|nr:hypothetical protein [Pangasius djambal]